MHDDKYSMERVKIPIGGMGIWYICEFSDKIGHYSI